MSGYIYFAKRPDNDAALLIGTSVELPTQQKLSADIPLLNLVYWAEVSDPLTVYKDLASSLGRYKINAEMEIFSLNLLEAVERLKKLTSVTVDWHAPKKDFSWADVIFSDDNVTAPISGSSNDSFVPSPIRNQFNTDIEAPSTDTLGPEQFSIRERQRKISDGGAFLALVALAGLSVVAGAYGSQRFGLIAWLVPVFCVALLAFHGRVADLIFKYRTSISKCEECQSEFSIEQTGSDRRLISRIPRFEHKSTSYGSTGQNLVEVTWVEETWETTKYFKCVICGNKLQKRSTSTSKKDRKSNEIYSPPF